MANDGRDGLQVDDRDGLQVIHDNPPLEYNSAGLPNYVTLKTETAMFNKGGTKRTKRTKYLRGPKLWLSIASLVLLFALIAVTAVLASNNKRKTKISSASISDQGKPSVISSPVVSSPVTATSATSTSHQASPSGTTPAGSDIPPNLAAVLVLPTKGILPNNCSTELDHHSTTISGFNATCNMDYGGGDFQTLTAYTFEQCLQACTSINSCLGDGHCFVISWFANFTGIPNCLLKNSTSGVGGPYTWGPTDSGQNTMIGAIVL